ncbi:MAG: S8 family serine peptidase [Dehalococcoidia bacterium]|nr:S8 family serine peptidase [Dehalococcoidia bacterium]
MVPGRVLVKARSGIAVKGLLGVLDQDVVFVNEIPQLGYAVLSVPVGQERESAKRLAASPLIQNAQPEFVYNVLREPNDYFFNRTKSDGTSTYYWQWNLRAINAPSAWDITTGSPNFVIAIVDTGIDDGHDDLVGKISLKVDYINEVNPFDGLGFHGSHVAGIAAANTDNCCLTPNIWLQPGGMAGMSWGAKLLSVKIADHFGKAPDTAAAQGIIYAADHGAKIINLSFGGEEKSGFLQDAINYAYNKGILIVAAAGNCGDPTTYHDSDCTRVNPPIYPAADDNVLAVGAMNRRNQRSSFSEYGGYVAVVAPGEEILSTAPNQRFVIANGTSQAAPHVAGLANLIWSVNPNLTNAQVANIITSTAVDLGPPGKDNEYGYGIIDARAAVARAADLTANTSAVAALAKSGGSEPVTRSLTLSTGALNVPWSAAVGAPWLSISPASGVTPAKVTLSMDPGSLGAGRHQSDVTFSASGPEVSRQTVTANLVLTDTILASFIPFTAVNWASGW